MRGRSERWIGRLGTRIRLRRGRSERRCDRCDSCRHDLCRVVVTAIAIYASDTQDISGSNEKRKRRRSRFGDRLRGILSSDGFSSLDETVESFAWPVYRGG